MHITRRSAAIGIALLPAAALVCTMLALPHDGRRQTAPAIPPATHHTATDVEAASARSSLKDGVPSKATADKLLDNLNFTYAYRAFMDNMRGVSIHALRKGMQSVGMKDNEVIVFEQLMDAKSLFLTANADTIYVMGFLDLTKGPVVLETPPKFLGAVQDAWFRWVIDVGGARARPRRRRQISDRRAGLHRTAAGGRLLCRALPDQHHRVVRSLVPGEPTIPSRWSKELEVHQGLSLRSRRCRHSHRRLPGRQGQTRQGRTASADRVSQRKRQGDEYPSAERLGLL